MLKKAKAEQAAARPVRRKRRPWGRPRTRRRQVLDSSHQIWLAGLGAFSQRSRRAPSSSDTLVKQGEELQDRTKRVATETAAAARAPRRRRQRRCSKWRRNVGQAGAGVRGSSRESAVEARRLHAERLARLPRAWTTRGCGQQARQMRKPAQGGRPAKRTTEGKSGAPNAEGGTTERKGGATERKSGTASARPARAPRNPAAKAGSARRSKNGARSPRPITRG
jgi:hypothetical protein